MIKILNIILLIFFLETALYSQLLINEFVTDTSSDWVEIFYASPNKEKMDISGLYVTMYYGTNENLGDDPITIYSYNRPETPYDDRFIVVHLAKPDIADETDLTGDTNHNGYIDVYCNNYHASLWNSDGVVAIDSDDDPSNGEIIDFVFYSNRDGSANSTIESYTVDAQRHRQWQSYSGDNIQECSVNIGGDGLASFMSISRINSNDTNSFNDFAVTNFQTPGGENLTSIFLTGRKLFKPLRKKITIVPNHPIFGKGDIPLFVFWSCNIKFRVFSITGIVVYESPLFSSVLPGIFFLNWNPYIARKPNLPTGLYICKIEASNPILKLTEERVIYIILSRYR